MEPAAVAANFRFPTDLPQYYFLMSFNYYRRQSWLEVGTLTEVGRIALPMPLQITDAAATEWEQERLGAIGGQLMNMGTGIADIFRSGGEGPGGAALNAGKGALGVLGGTGIDVLQNKLGKEAVGAAQATLGFSINQFLTMMFKGPVYKEHTFSWMLSPNDAQESRTLSLIREHIDRARQPGMVPYTGSAFFQWPMVVNMSFMHAGGSDMGARLYRFKPSIIKESTFEYTANQPQQVSFYGKTQAPESAKVTIKFQELEFWLRDDPRLSGAW
jgi:hypothetical protein